VRGTKGGKNKRGEAFSCFPRLPSLSWILVHLASGRGGGGGPFPCTGYSYDASLIFFCFS